MEYYHNINRSDDNLNDDLYPYGLGLFKATKLTEDILDVEFYACNLVDSSINVSSIWKGYYNYNYPDRTFVWNRHYSLEYDGTLAKQSDLTNAINSLGTISTKDMSNNTAYLDKAAYIAVDGVMEIGQYIDFHITGSSNTDYDIRLQANGNNLYISTPTGGGTFGYWTISKGTNGWARESSTGFTIQWGRTSNIGVNATSTISFPRTFSTVYSVTLGCQPGDDNKTAGRILVINRDNVTNSSFQVTNNGWAGTYVGARTHWIAIGIS